MVRGHRQLELSYLITTHEVKQSEPHIIFISGIYLTYKIKSGGSPRCRIYQSGCDEMICHVISEQENEEPQFFRDGLNFDATQKLK